MEFLKIANLLRSIYSAAKGKDWTTVVDTSEELIVLLGERFHMETASIELKAMSDSVQKGEYGEAGIHLSEFAIAVITIITGKKKSEFTTMAQDDFFEYNMMTLEVHQNETNWDPKAFTTTTLPPKAEAIPIGLILGLIQIFIKWRLNR